MDAPIPIYFYVIPAVLALSAKAVIYFYARSSGLRNLETQLYLLFLFTLSLQNLAEISVLTARAQNLLTPANSGMLYFTASIIALSLFLHLTVVLATNRFARSFWNSITIAIHTPAVILLWLLWSGSLLVAGFEPIAYTYTKTPGPLYFLFEIYTVGYISLGAIVLVYGGRHQITRSKQLKNKLMFLSLLPMFAVVVTVISLQHYSSFRTFNTTVTLPIAITFFLAISAYATHHYRLFDIEFYLPWSKVRRRKTKFYERIRAMIAEIADLGSVNQVVNRLADTLRCPVALLGGNKPVLALADGSPNMAEFPKDELGKFDHIIVANEIAESMPKTYSAMKRHGVAAIVPFYPHSQNVSSWLLLGDSFSDQVYTPLDFRMVEQLFDKMADLFLDKLLAMRTQLADANRQIHALEFRLQAVETNMATLQSEAETLRSENARLTREQPADSLIASAGQKRTAPTITLLGRDKAMRGRLRKHFPQTGYFVGPDSSSFKRQPIPDVLVCQLEEKARDTAEKLISLLVRQRGKTAALLYDKAAETFLFKHKKDLIGSLVEVMPHGLTDEALVRKVNALAELNRSSYALTDPDYPLIGQSLVFTEMMGEAARLAGFAEPILIQTHDTREAIVLAAHIHELSGREGNFNVLYTTKLVVDETQEEQIDSLIADTRNGTLMIDNVCALSNELWDKLLLATNEFDDIRLIAGGSQSVDISPDELLKPFRPFVLEMPGLRERKIDVPLLVHYFTLQFNMQAGTYGYLKRSEVDDLMATEYPKDLAELKSSVFTRLKSGLKKEVASGPEIKFDSTDKTLDEYVAEFEARLIEQTLKRCNGNKSKAARLLGLRPNTLHYKIERYGLVGKKK